MKNNNVLYVFLDDCLKVLLRAAYTVANIPG